jgi:hypothetical protein
MSGTDCLILTMGRSAEHVKTSLTKYSPNYLVLVTTEEFASTNRRRLANWKNRYDIKGQVLVIKDVFSEEGGLNTMMRIYEAYSICIDFNVESKILLGITGGTMNMAASAAAAASTLGIKMFYVIKPKSGKAIQPLRDVVELPAARAMSLMFLMPLRVLVLLKICIEDGVHGKGRYVLDAEMFDRINLGEGRFWALKEAKIIQNMDKKPGHWVITELGIEIISHVTNTPLMLKHIENFEEEKKNGEKNNSPMFG